MTTLAFRLIRIACAVVVLGVVSKAQLIVNEQCVNANHIAPSSGIVLGSTVGATPYPWCGLDKALYPGVFYAVIGTGNIMGATTCAPGITNYNSDMAVYDNCTLQTCVATNHKMKLPCKGDKNGYAYSMNWQTELNKIYYIFVSGVRDNNVGNFGLSIVDFPPASNSLCVNAELLPVNGSVVTGTTSNGGLSKRCGLYHPDTNSSLYQGVWYKVVGTGRLMMASTCHHETHFPSNISVMTGADCSSFPSVSSCVTAAGVAFEMSCSSNQKGNIFVWQSIFGQDYLIFISGVSISDSGKYGFSVTNVTVPSNNQCVDALPLPGNGTVVVSTTIGTYQTPHCGYNSRNGVWYRLIGTGGLMQVSTCTEETNYAAALVIQSFCTGGCVNTNKAANCSGNVDGFGQTLTWQSVVNRTYLVFVSGETSSDAGQFGISFKDNVVNKALIDACSSHIVTQCSCFKYNKCLKHMMRGCAFSSDKSIKSKEEKKTFKKAKKAMASVCR